MLCRGYLSQATNHKDVIKTYFGELFGVRVNLTAVFEDKKPDSADFNLCCRASVDNCPQDINMQPLENFRVWCAVEAPGETKRFLDVDKSVYSGEAAS